MVGDKIMWVVLVSGCRNVVVFFDWVCLCVLDCEGNEVDSLV